MKAQDVVMHTLTQDEKVELIEMGERLIDLMARCVEVAEELKAQERKPWMNGPLSWIEALIHNIQFVLTYQDPAELWRYSSTRNEAKNALRQISERIDWVYNFH